MDTLRSFKRCGAKGVYRQMSCRGITRQSAVLYSLLTQTIEAPKKRTVKSDKTHKKKKWKRTIVSKKTAKIKINFRAYLKLSLYYITLQNIWILNSSDDGKIFHITLLS